MERRIFIKDLALLASIPVIGQACKPVIDKRHEPSRIELVKKAMLSMQRASWEQGVAAQAVLETGDFDLVLLMAYEAVLRQTDQGRLSVLYTDNGVTDPASSGEAVLRAGEKYNDDTLKNAARKMLGYLQKSAPKSDKGIIYHTLSDPEIWIDSMYMAPPFLAVMGEYSDSFKQIQGIRECLWDGQARLYSNRWHNEKKEFINKKFWGVGNGWALAGITRVIKAYPNKMESERNTLIQWNTEHLDSCLNYLRPDGYFHNIIDDSSTFVETNFSQMAAYAIYSGIYEGWLKKYYIDVAELMRQAALNKVDKHGFVQDVCGAPWFNSPGRATEGQAFFILMESARNKLTL